MVAILCVTSIMESIDLDVANLSGTVELAAVCKVTSFVVVGVRLRVRGSRAHGAQPTCNPSASHAKTSAML